ncbi:hypothetical protein H0H81_002130 [Sphagnurus paluster]|uniref:Uncharacterized protein n=1 Tax=Sphagnurus paluster TaxID=117069 RepID=A0A9P7GN36_9AGAR|nr:hypothetical protein H0H81_002130 [Sphagnurus paluster]
MVKSECYEAESVYYTSEDEWSEDGFPEEESDDSDYQAPSRTGSKRKRVTKSLSARAPRKIKAPKNPPYVAKVTDTATSPVLDAAESTSRAMKLAAHPGTGENEAQAAMRMATKLMQSQNLTQADLIANETAEERSTRAGHSSVKITSTASKKVSNRQWYGVASNAACEAFDVQVYSQKPRDKSYLDWVFYGLADVRSTFFFQLNNQLISFFRMQNTVAAALAFEMLHNQIEKWTIENKAELKGRAAGNSYRHGVAERVLQDALKENKKAIRQAEADEKKRLQQEAAEAEAARAAELARLATPATASSVSPQEQERPQLFSSVEDDKDSEKVKCIVDPSGGSNLDENTSELPHLEQDTHNGEPPFSIDMYHDTMPADFDDDSDGDNGAADLDLDALEKKIQSSYNPLGPSAHNDSRSHAPSGSTTMGTQRVAKSPSVKNEISIEPVNGTVNDKPLDDMVPHWSSALQLRTFRDNAKSIAETYLKEIKIKLRKGRKLKELKHDKMAYRKGWRDGEKVDLKRRRIEGEAEKA